MPLAHEGAAPVPPEVTGCPAVNRYAFPPRRDTRSSLRFSATNQQHAYETHQHHKRTDEHLANGPAHLSLLYDDPRRRTHPLAPLRTTQVVRGHRWSHRGLNQLPSPTISGSFGHPGLNFAGRRRRRDRVVQVHQALALARQQVASLLRRPRPGVRVPDLLHVEISGGHEAQHELVRSYNPDVRPPPPSCADAGIRRALGSRLRTVPNAGRPRTSRSPPSRHCALCVHVRHSARAPQKETLFGSHMHSPIT